MFTYTTTLANPEATEAMAQAMAPYLMAGDVVAFTGYLGAGKSHFARTLISALGTRQTHLPSPTFTLLQTYDDTRLPVAHADFYRLGDPSEADELNLEPFIEHGLTFIEWADNAPHVCPDRALWVHLEDEGESESENQGENEGQNAGAGSAEGRRVTFENADKSWQKRFGFFASDLQRPVTDKGRHHFVQGVTGKRGHVISPVSADASFRSYWRVRLGKTTQILMDAPPPMEDLARFVRTGQYLEKIGVRAPHIFEADTENGYALLEDFGNTTVYGAIKSGADGLAFYEAAVDILVHIAHSEPLHVSRQSREEWLDEACLFTDWFLPYATGDATHTADRRYFRACIADLMAATAHVPTTTMHKDYHCQNLMVLNQGENAQGGIAPPLGVLDFQDSRLGPVSYDLASLLYDVRFNVPHHYHHVLIERFAEGFSAHGGVETLDTAPLEKAVKIMALQNLLRIAGVFTRLAYRDGKTEYLTHMPLLWSHVEALLDQLPEAEALAQFIDKHTPVKKEMAV